MFPLLKARKIYNSQKLMNSPPKFSIEKYLGNNPTQVQLRTKNKSV